MRTAQERIILLHSRANELRKKTNERILIITGVASACLMSILIVMMTQTNYRAVTSANSQFAGTSLLSESAGGYVLVAVIAFVAAVVITLICIRIRQKEITKKAKGQGEEDINNEHK